MTSRRPKQFKKGILVETKSVILKEKEPFQGFPFREWSVELFPVAAESALWPLEKWVEKVEFKLHDSFENPLKTFTEPPFKVTEVGWGEFRMEIIVYCKDEISPAVSFFHDLAFQPETFQKTHVITLRPKPAVEATIETLVGPSFVEEGGEKENETRKKRKSIGRSEESPVIKKKSFEFKPENWKDDEHSEEKMKTLALKLQALAGDEIFGVVDLIKEFPSVKSGSAEYNATPELIKFDLYTLEEEELTNLWEYCVDKHKSIPPV